MQSTIKNLVGTESILESLAGNARILILTALAASVLLIGGTQFGTAFAQPVSDTLVVFASSIDESWNSISEENVWPPYAPKVVISSGNASGLMAMAEENIFTPKLAITTGNANGLMAMAEENDFTPKLAIATGNANGLMAMAEENDFAPKVVIATGNANGLMAMAEENDFLGGAPKVVFTTGQAYISEENDFGV